MPEQQLPVDADVIELMQRDWNERAREDAHFYVAFGRRDQDSEEFFATATDQVRDLQRELRRLPLDLRIRARRALEIGCGPGRLMRPLSRHFGEIHGVDVSDEMIRRAAVNLQGIPHAHPHHTSGADLAPFADDSFDFVYSYAVFQHIPSREVVMTYLREAHRVLKPNGILRVQINGLDEAARACDTWSGVRISEREVRDFARENGMQLLALEGVRTQYMWTTMRKAALSSGQNEPNWEAAIRRITNAHSSEPVAPASGRFASVSLWVEGLPEFASLNHLRVTVDGIEASPSYLGPIESDGIQQLNVMLPELSRTGLVPVEIFQGPQSIADPHPLRIIPSGPRVPVLVAVSDGINIMSGLRVVSGVVKVTLEETLEPEQFSASISGRSVGEIDIFCADPLPPRHEINFRVPEATPAGANILEMSVGHRRLGPVTLDVVR